MIVLAVYEASAVLVDDKVKNDVFQSSGNKITPFALPTLALAYLTPDVVLLVLNTYSHSSFVNVRQVSAVLPPLAISLCPQSCFKASDLVLP